MGKALNKYYEFHECKGHATEDCWELKNNLDDLIRAGHFKRYKVVRRLNNDKRSEDENREDRKYKKEEETKKAIIFAIHGGLGSV